MVYVILFLVCELLDVFLNKATNFKDLVYGYVTRWQKSKILFFATQFTFIYLNFIVFTLDKQSFWIVTLYILYGLDVAYKVYLSEKISKNTLSDDLKQILKFNIKIPFEFRLLISLSMSIILYMGL
ncbi:MAG: hypothetical protein GXZ15_06315 [Campylobacter sp.]|nr:hypothetical protein [Campylobacter sp.]